MTHEWLHRHYGVRDTSLESASAALGEHLGIALEGRHNAPWGWYCHWVSMNTHVTLIDQLSPAGEESGNPLFRGARF